jgi:hypothetical protein
MKIDSTFDLDERAGLTGEERRVLRWRYEQFLSLGLSHAECRVLADGDCDLNVVRRLVDAGCPPGLAFRIAL